MISKGIKVVVFIVAGHVLGFGCASALGPKERSEITTTAATIHRCQEEGRACKADGGAGCYDACMRDAGFR